MEFTKENFITLENLYERVKFILESDHLSSKQQMRYIDQSFYICNNTLKELN